MTKPVFDLSYPKVSIYQSNDTFPVHRIYCVGQNYTAHTLEMGGDPSRDAPFFFSKPSDAACNPSHLPWPEQTNNLHFEVELVVALGSSGTNMSLAQAQSSIYAYAVGVDLTRRDLQQVAKKKGRPWDTAKGFDLSAPLGQLVKACDWQPEQNTSITLMVNAVEQQSSSLDKMIWNVPELIKELSRFYALQAGDIIFTGTPAGVGALTEGDKVLAMIDGLPDLSFVIGG